jgi:hypothetical protein
MPARAVPAKHGWAALTLLVVGSVALGSPGVAHAYPSAGSQWDQDGSSRGHADATGGAAVPPNWPQMLVVGNMGANGNYGAVGTPVVDNQIRSTTGTLVPPMPIAMPSGRMAPARKTAAIGGQTAVLQDEQPAGPSGLPGPIVAVGAQ